MYGTHHSAQVMLLHQVEGVLVAGGEVVGLCRAHVTSGHRPHGVDHICGNGTSTSSFKRGLLFSKDKCLKLFGGECEAVKKKKKSY